MTAREEPLPDPAPSRPRRFILAALMCTMLLAAMDTTIVSTAIPQIVGDLGGFAYFSWVFSIYLLAQTVTIPLYGKLADLIGRKPVLIAGTLVFLVGSAASAASWNMVSLIAFRGLQGIGAGSIMATVTTLAGDLYPVRERGVIQGWLSSVWGIAAIAGPVLGAPSPTTRRGAGSFSSTCRSDSSPCSSSASSCTNASSDGSRRSTMPGRACSCSPSAS